MDNHWLIVDKDLKVKIQYLQQSYTYDSFIMGYPTAHRNKWLLKNLPISKKYKENIKGYYYIEPTETIIDPEEQKHRKPIDIHQEFPLTMCIARLKTDTVKSETEIGTSFLNLMWFQDDYGYPNDEILEKIKQIPYREVCGFEEDDF